MIHPFHPLYKHEFILLDNRHNWGEERVFYYDENGELKSLPTQWTNVIAQDPFVKKSSGRAYFNINGLIELTEIIKKIKNEKNSEKRCRK